MSDKSKKPISFGNLEKYTEQINEKFAEKTEIPTDVSQLNNDSKFQTDTDVDAKISAKLGSAYHAGGTISSAALTAALLIAANEGKVYNLSDEFTTDENFVDEAGNTYPAGTDVAVINTDTTGNSPTYKFNVMAGFVDLSAYAQTDKVASDISAAKTEAIQAAGAAADEKLAGYVKTADLEEITDEDIEALFADD